MYTKLRTTQNFLSNISDPRRSGNALACRAEGPGFESHYRQKNCTHISVANISTQHLNGKCIVFLLAHLMRGDIMVWVGMLRHRPHESNVAVVLPEVYAE
jgi:hypothetical protein